MISEAERRGLLRPGGTIIEATAGNTGVGLAMVAAVRGYRCIFVLPDKMASEKIALLKAYGAEVVITATSVAPDSPDSYNGVADRLAREIPGAWRPNQFTNLANPEIHYHQTGPEIWEQTEGQDHRLRLRHRHRRHHLRRGPLPQGAQARREDHRRRPRGQRPVAAARRTPGRSRASARTSSPRRSTASSSMTGSASATPSRSTSPGSCRAARASWPAAPAAPTSPPPSATPAAARADDLIVTLVCDTGRNYLSKFFDDAWLAANNLTRRRRSRRSRSATCSSCAARGRMVDITPEATVADAIDLMQTSGISQLPVLQDGKSVGSIQEVTLARVLHDNGDPPEAGRRRGDGPAAADARRRGPPRRGLPAAAVGQHRACSPPSTARCRTSSRASTWCITTSSARSSGRGVILARRAGAWKESRGRSVGPSEPTPNPLPTREGGADRGMRGSALISEMPPAPLRPLGIGIYTSSGATRITPDCAASQLRSLRGIRGYPPDHPSGGPASASLIPWRTATALMPACGIGSRRVIQV